MGLTAILISSKLPNCLSSPNPIVSTPQVTASSKVINYWLSQSKSIRKDLFNLFIELIYYTDCDDCTYWVVNTNPSTPNRLMVHLRGLSKGSEPLKTHFSWKRAPLPENMTQQLKCWWTVGWRATMALVCLCSLPLSFPATQRREVPSWEGTAI